MAGWQGRLTLASHKDWSRFDPCSSCRKPLRVGVRTAPVTPENRRNASELRDEIRAIGKRLADEDQDALHRLVAIRHSLW